MKLALSVKMRLTQIPVGVEWDLKTIGLLKTISLFQWGVIAIESKKILGLF
jgi:hypothetical protein